MSQAPDSSLSIVRGIALGEEPGMGIKFVYSADNQRSEFEGVVETLMSTSLGSDLASKLLNKSVK